MKQIETHIAPPPIRTALIALCVIGALLQIIMALRYEINWDEFYLLSLSYEMQNGTYHNPLQSIYFHAFSWLPNTGNTEISQIISARLIMLMCLGLVCIFIYKTARRFYGINASLIAALSYLAFSFVFRIGANFRVEIMVTMVLMCAIWLVTDPRQNWIKTIAIGFLIGLAGMMTMKAIFYMPIIAAFLLYRWQSTNWSKLEFARGATMFATALLSFAGLYLLHKSTLPTVVNSADYAASMGGKSLFQGGFIQQADVLVKALIQNPIYWVAIMLVDNPLRKAALTPPAQRAYPIYGLIAFLAPLFSLVFYFHSYEYYYIFMLAPASILIAATVEHFTPKFPRKLPLAIVIVLGLQLATVFTLAQRRPYTYQTQLLDIVHATYADPVPYIDYCGMISSFPRVEHPALFMNKTTFSQREYFQARIPVMDRILREHKPKFFIANVPALDLDERFQHVFDNQLLTEDKQTLADNYIRYWGPLYLPGKQFELTDNAPVVFDIIIDGAYKLMSDTSVIIDGQTVQPWQSINLTQSTHTIVSSQGGTARIIFGSPPENLKDATTGYKLFHKF